MIFGQSLAKITTEQLNNKKTCNDYSTDLLFHSYNVGVISGEIAKSLGMDNYKDIILMGNFHDLGKSQIDNNILFKKGRVTKSEFEEIKKHPVYSEEIILDSMGNTIINRSFAKAVRHHHENFDGSGYPDGLKGEEIPVESRILAIADVFDAIINPRIYRNYTIEFPIELMKSCEYKFDKEIFYKAIPILSKWYKHLREE